MKNKIVVMIACVAIVFPSYGFAQSKWKAEARGGWDIDFFDDVLSNWRSGGSAGVGLACQVNPYLEVSTVSAYHHFTYEGGNTPLIVSFLGSELNFEGEDSYIVEASIAGRVSDPGNKRGPYLTLRGGLYYIEVGRISVISWTPGYPYSYSNTAYKDTDTTLVKPFGSVGAGYKIPVTKRMRIILEIGYATTFDFEQITLPLLATVQWDL